LIVMLGLGAALAGFGADTMLRRDSARSLNVPPWWEVAAVASAESFTSRLSAWQWHTVALRYRGKSASHSLEGFTARRFDRWDSGVAVEESRTIGRGAYLAVRVQLAPRATIVARSDVSASWYQAIGAGWEIIPSARLMSFAQERIPILGLGLGRYTGLWYLSGRVNQSSQSGQHGITTSAEIRRYAAATSANFVDATVSYGHELAVLGPSTVALRQTSSATARAQRMVSRHVGMALTVTYDANASLPDRRGGGLLTFIRW
jgi:YaiO family outer membrane protein